MMADIARKARRIGFHLRGVARNAVPRPIYVARRRRLFSESEPRFDGAIAERVNYYNAMPDGPLPPEAVPISKLPLDKSYYYFDLTEHTNHFPGELAVNYLFGDITTVPPVPTIVKSRPIDADNRNSVILKLNRFRHYYWKEDRLDFRAKKKSAVWRGGMFNPVRRALVTRFTDHPRLDIGYVGRPKPPLVPKAFMPMEEQFRYRYILSVEGNDVATNLKWIFASNSLCMMPRPRIETWFMEGRLLPGVHYVELRPDFDDLEEKVDYYDRHEDEAIGIVANAKAHFRPFLDKRREELIALLVLQKYFERTGQLPPEPFSAALFAREAAYSAASAG